MISNWIHFLLFLFISLSSFFSLQEWLTIFVRKTLPLTKSGKIFFSLHASQMTDLLFFFYSRFSIFIPLLSLFELHWLCFRNFLLKTSSGFCVWCFVIHSSSKIKLYKQQIKDQERHTYPYIHLQRCLRSSQK